jgi:hypothetical protein
MRTDHDSKMGEPPVQDDTTDWREFMDREDMTNKDQMWARAATALMQKRYMWEQKIRRQAQDRGEWAVA